ncbi:uncharacterized protein BO97DRAFT_278083 [Aspergillus homomorphus CBS 101889]|uniref:Uncharacterized protein n=1 Tax=Aspergillus homomorphus (strain CBS 101889) TaxID=1450537 RepID=A0A395HJ03_ASPHC|nr:hypothetical protein BO97DRAFT_278083 [Aspergillus homomorphus CBS 101889]RAL06878.1 hypothetical protein BO97DRAFT_278083 [Aspergillus homomorphus CBS 101889]
MPHIPIEPGNFPATRPIFMKRRCDNGLAGSEVPIHTSKRIQPPPVLRPSSQTNAIDYSDVTGNPHERDIRQRSFSKRPRLHKQLAPTNSLTFATSSFYSSPSPRTLSPNDCQPSTFCLLPCHVCHRRPTTRETLDAYSDCEICGQRSCYICLRSCDAVDCSGLTRIAKKPSGYMYEDTAAKGKHAISRRVCSSCAVEDLDEMGVVVSRCLDCVAKTTT